MIDDCNPYKTLSDWQKSTSVLPQQRFEVNKEGKSKTQIKKLEKFRVRTERELDKIETKIKECEKYLEKLRDLKEKNYDL